MEWHYLVWNQHLFWHSAIFSKLTSGKVAGIVSNIAPEWYLLTLDTIGSTTGKPREVTVTPDRVILNEFGKHRRIIDMIDGLISSDAFSDREGAERYTAMGSIRPVLEEGQLAQVTVHSIKYSAATAQAPDGKSPYGRLTSMKETVVSCDPDTGWVSVHNEFGTTTTDFGGGLSAVGKTISAAWKNQMVGAEGLEPPTYSV